MLTDFGTLIQNGSHTFEDKVICLCELVLLLTYSISRFIVIVDSWNANKIKYNTIQYNTIQYRR